MLRGLIINHSLLASLLRSKLGKSFTKSRKRMVMKKRSPCMLIFRKKSHEKVAKIRTASVDIKGNCINGTGLGRLELG